MHARSLVCKAASARVLVRQQALKSGEPVQEVVHPRVMEQIVSCRDDIAQQYLMQVRLTTLTSRSWQNLHLCQSYNHWLQGRSCSAPRSRQWLQCCFEKSFTVQAVIQGFPDDFHLGTLPSLLSAVGKLQAGVKIHAVLSSLLDRLARCRPVCYVRSDATQHAACALRPAKSAP